MKRRICAVVLALGLLVGSASALTADQLGYILENYYIDEVPERVLEQTTIEDMLDALGDPYTEYFYADEYKDFMGSMEDTLLVGIGIRAQYLPEGVLISQVAPDSPAGEAGLKAGDYIVAVDGKDTRGAASADVTQWIRGEEGTWVQVTVLQDGGYSDLRLKRRSVVFPTVTLDKIEDGIGWITCASFGTTTFAYFYDIITQNDEEVDQWVVDLRGNVGGDALAAMFSAGCFAGRGQGGYLRDSDGAYHAYLHEPLVIPLAGYYHKEVDAFDGAGYLTEDPVYVLTDESTASAAELFCASIRDSGAGLIIGSRTFGKGVAQSVYSQDFLAADMEGFFDGGDAVKVTTQKVFSTRGGTFDLVGILPHFRVDANLADEVAALLAAPVSNDEDVLYILNLSATSVEMTHMVLPVSALEDPDNAEVVEQILSALPATVSCQLRIDGELIDVTPEQVAERCGITLTRLNLTDIDDSPYYDAIDTLATYGVITGPGDGTYLPDTNLDRASLCALLVKAMRYPLSTGKAYFADVPEDAWYAPYVNAMYERGLITGNDGMFYPNDPVTNEQFFTIMSRIAQWMDMDYYERAKHDGIYGDNVPSADELLERYDTFADWALEHAWLCDGSIAWGSVAGIDGKGLTTREEAARAVYGLLRASGTLLR